MPQFCRVPECQGHLIRHVSPPTDCGTRDFGRPGPVSRGSLVVTKLHRGGQGRRGARGGPDPPHLYSPVSGSPAEFTRMQIPRFPGPSHPGMSPLRRSLSAGDDAQSSSAGGGGEGPAVHGGGRGGWGQSTRTRAPSSSTKVPEPSPDSQSLGPSPPLLCCVTVPFSGQFNQTPHGWKVSRP